METHPFPPFVPDGARVLIMGTFPPPSSRWSMQFYYPNRTNDFWKIFGLLFYGDESALVNVSAKTFYLDRICRLLTDKGIALHDTGHVVRRLKNNASDKFLEIVEPVDLDSLVMGMPDLRAICTTGEKASQVVASLTGTEPPKMGQFVVAPAERFPHQGRPMPLWRMPSTSRAYPLPLADKAAYYAEMLRSAGIELWPN